MKGEANFTGVIEQGNFAPIPAGEYELRISNVVDKRTKNKDYMAVVEFEVIEGFYKGRKLWHNVVFLPPDNKGAGIAKHFLHVIGEPYQGDRVEFDTERWFNKKVKANVSVESSEWNGQLKERNAISYFVNNGYERSVESTSKEEETVPF